MQRHAHKLQCSLTGSPTITTVNLGMNLHGLTRSKELVDTFHKVGACIGYGLVRLLRDAWAVHDLQLCTDCPNEITEDKPGVIIVDNDDFHNDTLTGANTSHHTNVMYVQRDSLEDQGPQCGDHVKDAKTLSSALKEIAPCWTWLGTCQWPLQTSSPYTTSPSSFTSSPRTSRYG